jgi:hypothetical protein
VVLGHRLGAALAAPPGGRWVLARRRPTPAVLHSLVPGRWSRPEADPRYTTLWQDIKTAMGCFTILLLPFILALVVLSIEFLLRLFDR